MRVGQRRSPLCPWRRCQRGPHARPSGRHVVQLTGCFGEKLGSKTAANHASPNQYAGVGRCGRQVPSHGSRTCNWFVRAHATQMLCIMLDDRAGPPTPRWATRAESLFHSSRQQTVFPWPFGQGAVKATNIHSKSGLIIASESGAVERIARDEAQCTRKNNVVTIQLAIGCAWGCRLGIE